MRKRRDERMGFNITSLSWVKGDPELIAGVVGSYACVWNIVSGNLLTKPTLQITHHTQPSSTLCVSTKTRPKSPAPSLTLFWNPKPLNMHSKPSTRDRYPCFGWVPSLCVGVDAGSEPDAREWVRRMGWRTERVLQGMMGLESGDSDVGGDRTPRLKKRTPRIKRAAETIEEIPSPNENGDRTPRIKRGLETIEEIPSPNENGDRTPRLKRGLAAETIEEIPSPNENGDRTPRLKRGLAAIEAAPSVNEDRERTPRLKVGLDEIEEVLSPFSAVEQVGEQTPRNHHKSLGYLKKHTRSSLPLFPSMNAWDDDTRNLNQDCREGDDADIPMTPVIVKGMLMVPLRKRNGKEVVAEVYDMVTRLLVDVVPISPQKNCVSGQQKDVERMKSDVEDDRDGVAVILAVMEEQGLVAFLMVNGEYEGGCFQVAKIKK
ncbi:hypothetical protein BC829DRAFT_482029 [Chytridium lagenaria]|nr:hypothetical protein BC829DRAFT_482029 [Chytridium lagenaria]